MTEKTKQFGLVAKNGNLTLKPLKKLHFKQFADFSKEYDGEEIKFEDYLQLWSSKEFQFMQTGRLWLYLFEAKSQNKFDVGEIVGYSEITPIENEKNTAEIGYFVKKSKRNCGKAKQMLEMTKEICKKMGYQTLTAKTEKQNAPSIAVLKSAGFEECENASETSKFHATLKI